MPWPCLTCAHWSCSCQPTSACIPSITQPVSHFCNIDAPVLGSQNPLSSASHPHSDPLSYTQELLLLTATALSAWHSDAASFPRTQMHHPQACSVIIPLRKPQNRTVAEVQVRCVGSSRAGVLGGGSPVTRALTPTAALGCCWHHNCPLLRSQRGWLPHRSQDKGCL